MGEYYIKTNRIFTRFRSYIWILTPLVAIGGLFERKLGLLIPPIMLALIIMSFFRGRYWCGNFCSHGSFYDKYLLKLSRNKKIYKFLSSKLVMAAFFLWFMFNITKKMILAINSFGTNMFLDNLGFVFTSAYLMVLILGGFISIINSPRAWCKVCPMGIMQKASYKAGGVLKITDSTDKVLTIKSKEECHLCGKCARVCPMQLEPYLNFDDKNRFISNECIKCNTCVKNCPASILSLENNKKHITGINSRRDFVNSDNRKEITGVIKSRKMINCNVLELILSMDEIVEKKIGGFILLKIQDNPIQYRAYTVAKYIDNKTISIIIKLEEKGYGTNIIFSSFNEGNRITIKGPIEGELSKFSPSEKVIFIAGGIGFTPFVELTKEALDNVATEVNLIYAARYNEDLIYGKYFEDISNHDSRFRYTPILSREEKDGIIKGSALNYLRNIDNINEYKIYVCSSKRLSDDIKKLLLDKGVSRENVFIESL